MGGPPLSRSAPLLFLLALTLGSCLAAKPTPERTHPQDPTTVPTPEATAEALPTISATGEAPACPVIESLHFSQLREIENQASQLRGLIALDGIDRVFMRGEQVQDQVLNTGLTGHPPDDAQAQMYYLLGLIPEPIDLHALNAALLSEQVASYYDLESAQLFLDCEAPQRGLAQLSYIHDYDLALLDQHFSLGSRSADAQQACDHDPQRCIALQALIEGDAALLQEQWLRTFTTPDDLNELRGDIADLPMPVYESAPSFIRDDFTFPYLEGLFFVRSLYLSGGWPAVDAAHLDPPQTTEQILHPARYPADHAVVLDPPALDGLTARGWEVLQQRVMGEWVVRNLLGRHLEGALPGDAAMGWGGDIAFLLDNPALNVQAFLVVIQWDTLRDAHEFSAAFQEYGTLRFGEALQATSTQAAWDGGGMAAMLDRQSNQTLVIITTSADNLQALRDAVVLPLRTLQ